MKVFKPGKQKGSPQPVVRTVDMPYSMQVYAIRLALKALESKISECEMAVYIKSQFDRSYGPGWMCIVGRSFGSYVSYAFGCFMFFELGNEAFQLFKAP
ncbi:unnamed protein product [Soboliphyme baturini]|uniref:Dynein light chain n=1 Tax=Soboliphyme baturini TaxID=241478 RepID=A0A183IFT1_9BILA|nr:unnamed protein product [Soboliphyme baturini]